MNDVDNASMRRLKALNQIWRQKERALEYHSSEQVAHAGIRKRKGCRTNLVIFPEYRSYDLAPLCHCFTDTCKFLGKCAENDGVDCHFGGN